MKPSDLIRGVGVSLSQFQAAALDQLLTVKTSVLPAAVLPQPPSPAPQPPVTFAAPQPPVTFHGAEHLQRQAPAHRWRRTGAGRRLGKRSLVKPLDT